MSYITGTATDFLDLLQKVHDYVVDKGTAYGLRYEGVGNGTINDLRGGAGSVAETITVTFTGASAFNVVGSVSGSLPGGTVGTPYSESEVEFELTAGGTAFQSGDEFTFSTAPKWTSLREAYGTKSYSASLGNTGSRGFANVFEGIHGPGSNINDEWRVDSGVSFPITGEIEFHEAETIVEYAIRAGNDGTGASYAPQAWTLQYWNGSTWITLDTQSAQSSWGVREIRTYTVSSPVSATRYRLNITTGNSASGICISEWFMRRTSGGFNAATGQVLLKAPGNDGNSEIFVGFHPFYRLDADYYNWLVCGFDGHLAAEEFLTQPNISKHNAFMPLIDSSMEYWIVANGRRVVVVSKISTQYESCYLGFYDSFFPPNEQPYPMAIGASMHRGVQNWAWQPGNSPTWESSTIWRYDQNVSRHSAFTHSDPGTSSITADDSTLTFMANLLVRQLDGSYWPAYAGRTKSYVSHQAGLGRTYNIWPLTDNPVSVNPNFDGSYTLFPIQLLAKPVNPAGQLDGVAWVTGQSIAAESELDEGPRKWIVFPDISRNTRLSFFALELN